MTKKRCQDILDRCEGKVRLMVEVDATVSRTSPIMFDYFDKMDDYGSLTKDKNDDHWIEITTIDEQGSVDGFDSFTKDKTWDDVYQGLLRAYEYTRDWENCYADELLDSPSE